MYISSPDPATVILIGAGGGGTAFCALAGGVAGGGVGAGAPAIRVDARAGVTVMVSWGSVAVARFGGRGSVAIARGFIFRLAFIAFVSNDYCLLL